MLDTFPYKKRLTLTSPYVYVWNPSKRRVYLSFVDDGRVNNILYLFTLQLNQEENALLLEIQSFFLISM